MIFTQTKLKGAYFIDIEKIEDARGFFGRFWCLNEFKEIGLNTTWVQGNHSFSKANGTLRGLHYQKDPFQDVKLVRCTRGRIFDVIIDLKIDSDSYGNWLGVFLAADEHRSIYVPAGFAHGYITLEANTEVDYLVSQLYKPDSEAGIRYNDPFFEIQWPVDVEVISDKDLNWPDFSGRTPNI